MNIEILFRFDDEPSVASRDVVSLMLERTDGDPCCAFEVRLLYSDAAADAARRASSIQIYHGGVLRFTGVLDEVITARDALGYAGRAAIAAPTTALSTRVPQAEWLLEQAEREAEELEITVAGAFAAAPCDALRLNLAGFPASATVSAARTEIDTDGARTTITAYTDETRL